jgi:hypothetical protein
MNASTQNPTQAPINKAIATSISRMVLYLLWWLGVRRPLPLVFV